MAARIRLVLLALLLFAPAAISQPIRDIEPFITEVRSTFEVPGLALAVVKDGRVVLAQGFGVKDVGTGEGVTSETLFGIASNSKAFTGAALGILVEQGKLEWDRPVVDYMPWFQLSDPYVSRELTVRDLLVHRSGLSLGAGDLLWWPATDLGSKDITLRLRHVPLSTSFRSAYAYDNVLYVAAGMLIQEVTGRTWEQFVAEHILQPVGMDGVKIGPTAALASPDVALPHAPVEGRVRRVPPFMGENANAAAGLYAGADDMARWMIALLDSGRVSPEKRLFTPGTTKALWSLVTPLPIGDPTPGLEVLTPNFSGYGLGFFVKDYRGKKIVTHTGGLPGYVSQVTLVPEMKLGIAVLTNQESGAAFTTITQQILDAYLGASEVDWLRVMRERNERYLRRMAEVEAAIAAARDSTARPSLGLPSYVGVYTDPWYGDVVVYPENDELRIRFAHTPWLIGDLLPWQYDTFVARWDDRAVRADAFVTFSLNPDGSIRSVAMEPVSPATDFSFDFQDLDLKPAADRQR